MKKVIFILFIVLIVSCKKEDFSPDLTMEFSILSKSNGANYNIKVALPQNFNPATQKYATIYVLDGEENFDFVAEKCLSISTDFATPNVLVVSIGYGNDRAIDYTPVEGGGGAVNGGGGAEKFLIFIKNELIPMIENEYGADTLRKNRTILGHSFGGLCGAYAFTNYNQAFGNYILLSPSLWYADEIVFKFEQVNRNINKNNHQLVFLGMGEIENSGQMLAPFQAFYHLLQNNYPDMVIKSHLEPQLNHRGSENPNIIEGLKFYFQNR
jgi:predicted alpha/beta superfamily hydrolase